MEGISAEGFMMIKKKMKSKIQFKFKVIFAAKNFLAICCRLTIMLEAGGDNVKD